MSIKGAFILLEPFELLLAPQEGLRAPELPGVNPRGQPERIIEREPKFGLLSLAKLSIVRDSSNMKYHDLFKSRK